MIDRNPLAPCLSHLAQRDAAVWRRAIEAVADLVSKRAQGCRELDWIVAACELYQAHRIILELKDKPDV